MTSAHALADYEAPFQFLNPQSIRPGKPKLRSADLVWTEQTNNEPSWSKFTCRQLIQNSVVKGH
jgi:hypothetical protein